MTGGGRPPGRRAARRPGAVLALAALYALTIVACAAVAGTAQLEATDAFVAETGRDLETGAPSARVRSENPDVVAWLEVEGTGISLPVAHAVEEDRGFYLDHDVFGRPSAAGCPYLDARCSPAGPVLIVYGHRMGDTYRMFSDLGECYRKERFSRLGRATWTDPSGTSTQFEPAFALKVDSTWSGLDASPRAGGAAAAPDGLAHWLVAVSKQADAKSREADSLCAGATRALVLVTCSSSVAGGPERTVAVFVFAR